MSLTGPAEDPMPDHADVELRLPADGAYVAVLRTTTAGLAARLDFTLDDIGDLRVAVGEACSLALPHADAGGDLVTRFFLDESAMTVEVSVTATAPRPLDQESFAWQVLTTLADEASVESRPGRFAITLAMRSSLAPS